MLSCTYFKILNAANFFFKACSTEMLASQFNFLRYLATVMAASGRPPHSSATILKMDLVSSGLRKALLLSEVISSISISVLSNGVRENHCNDMNCLQMIQHQNKNLNYHILFKNSDILSKSIGDLIWGFVCFFFSIFIHLLALFFFLMKVGPSDNFLS